MRSTVNNTMTYCGGKLTVKLRSQKCDEFLECIGKIADFRCRPRFFGEALSRFVRRAKVGLGAYPVYLPLEAPLRNAFGSCSEELELDAGTTGVNDQDGFCHSSGANWLRGSQPVSQEHGYRA